ncbi:acyltransferase family protein [Rhodococcus sp. WS3]|uniref:acyltransferase family protein n=1 Tax=Rhodococcus sp. WS3 TaxID=2486271 RepID=UPI001651893F|nr:acyltransferase family protein [Rhodococcus sp. WS3]
MIWRKNARQRLVRIAHAEVTPTAGAGRLAWVDVARGACVLLVVLHHVVRQFDAESDGPWRVAVGFWMSVDTVLTPIRIPLFFLISGLLASSKLLVSLNSAKMRYIVPLYLYFLWSVLLGVREFMPGQNSGSAFDTTTRIAASIALVCSGYWYLFALPLYFFLARLLYRWNRVSVLLLLAVPMIFRVPITDFFVDISVQLTGSPSLLGSVFANVIFFVIGAYYREQIIEFATGSDVVRLLFGFLAYSGLIGLYVWTNISVISLVASVIGIAFGITAAFLAGNSVFARWLNYIGARTLPVYVLQFFFISVLAFVWSISGDRIESVITVGAFAYPVALTILITVVSLVFYRVAPSVRLGFLFEPPRWLVRS